MKNRQECSPHPGQHPGWGRGRTEDRRQAVRWGPTKAKSWEGGRCLYGKVRRGSRRRQRQIPAFLPFFKVGTVSSDVWPTVFSSRTIWTPSTSQLRGLRQPPSSGGHEREDNLPISREQSGGMALAPSDGRKGQANLMPYQHPTCGDETSRRRAPRDWQRAAWSSPLLSNAPRACKGRNSGIL